MENTIVVRECVVQPLKSKTTVPLACPALLEPFDLAGYRTKPPLQEPYAPGAVILESSTYG